MRYRILRPNETIKAEDQINTMNNFDPDIQTFAEVDPNDESNHGWILVSEKYFGEKAGRYEKGQINLVVRRPVATRPPKNVIQ